MNILTGPREERTNEAARARIPMTAANVRWVIDQMAAAKTNMNARKRMAELALKVGNTSEDGKAVWLAYLATFA